MFTCTRIEETPDCDNNNAVITASERERKEKRWWTLSSDVHQIHALALSGEEFVVKEPRALVFSVDDDLALKLRAEKSTEFIRVNDAVSIGIDSVEDKIRLMPCRVMELSVSPSVGVVSRRVHGIEQIREG